LTNSADRRAKVWTRLHCPPDHGISKIEIVESPVFAQQSFTLNRLNLVTGTHGAGKSYLIRSIAAMLPDHHGYGYPPGPPFFTQRDIVDGALGGKLAGIYLHEGVERLWNADISHDQFEDDALKDLEGAAPWAYYLDPSVALSEYGMLYQEYSYFKSGNMERGEPQSLRREELESLRDILGRKYENFERSEVRYDAFDEYEFWVPFVTATVEGRQVSTANMSTGELWVHYALWVLSTAEPGQILLIDEPEAFLSPTGHKAFLDEIARLTLAKNTQTIIATHSVAMISHAPCEFIRVVVTGSTGAKIFTPVNKSTVMRMLGHESSLTGIVLVEDVIAQRMTKAALSHVGGDLARCVDIVDSGGKDEALGAFRVMRRSTQLKACVVLDGDQRSSGRTSSDPEIFYLPGDSPDEELLRQARSSPDKLAHRLSADMDEVQLALDAIRFQPHQYWFSGLAASLQVPVSELIDHLISLWLSEPSTREALAQLVEDIRDSLMRR